MPWLLALYSWVCKIFLGGRGIVSSSNKSILLGPSEKSARRSMDISVPYGKCSFSIWMTIHGLNSVQGILRALLDGNQYQSQNQWLQSKSCCHYTSISHGLWLDSMAGLKENCPIWDIQMVTKPRAPSKRAPVLYICPSMPIIKAFNLGLLGLSKCSMKKHISRYKPSKRQEHTSQQVAVSFNEAKQEVESLPRFLAHCTSCCGHSSKTE